MVAQPNMTTLPEWQQKLAERGILEPALNCGWHYKEYNGATGWQFPLLRFNGQRFTGVDRWKAMDRKTAPQPYAWLGKKPDDCQYYWHGADTQTAIEDDWNTLYITAGEPDMLTMIAAGHRNVTSFFGEKIVPKDLLKDLQRIKVLKVIYLADMDEAGLDGAQAVIKALDGLIICQVKKLPREYNGKQIKDTNDLWIACEFNKETFDAVLKAAPDWKFGQERKPYYNYEKYAEEVENRWGFKAKTGSKWTKNFSCPYHGDDKHGSAGYNFDTKTLFCFVCGSHDIHELANDKGVNLEDFNENAGKLRIFDGEYKENAGKQAAAPTEMFVSSDKSLEYFIERMDGKHVNEVTAAPFPFTILHSLGGFCEILKPRKMVGVIGLSGGGKTSFLESMMDILRQAGEFHTLWWGKEWSWQEMADRAVQRMGGLTMTQIARYEMYMSETANGGQSKYGKKPLQEAIEQSKQYARDIQAWKGKAFYIDKSTDLQTTLEQAQVELDRRKQEGMRIRVAVWDYASLFDVRGARGEGEAISRGLALVKDFGEANDLFTFVASQPRKDDASRVKDGDKVLTAEDAMYMNDHKFNLLMTLNPTYVDNTMQDWGVINVVKNSGGGLGKVAVQMDLRRLRWLDQKPRDGWSPQ